MLFGNLEDKSKGLSSSSMIICSVMMGFVLLSFKIHKLEVYYRPHSSTVLHSKTDLPAKNTWKLKEKSFCQQFLFPFDLHAIPGIREYFIFLGPFQAKSVSIRDLFYTKPEKVHWSGFWLTHSTRFPPLGQRSLPHFLAVAFASTFAFI